MLSKFNSREFWTNEMPIWLVITGFIGVAVSYSKVYLFHLVLFSLATYVFFRVVVKKDFSLTKKPNMDIWFWCLYVVWFLLSSLWSNHWMTSIKYSLYPLMCLLMIYNIFNFVDSKDRLQRLIYCLSIIFWVHVGICLLEAYTIFRLPISPCSSVVEFFQRTHTNMLDNPALREYALSQPTSFFWHPNHVAMVSLLGLPFCLFHRRGWVQVIGSFSVAIIILEAGSRSLLVIYLVTVLLFFMIQVVFQKKIKEASIVALAFLLGTILFFKAADETKISEMKNSVKVFGNYASSLYDVSKAQLLGDGVKGDAKFNEAVSERLVFTIGGLGLLKESKFFGTGAGSLSHVKFDFNGRSYSLKSLHNYWLEILIEAGLLLFLLYVSWYIWTVVRLLKKANSFESNFLKYIASSVAVSLIIFSVGVITLSSAIYMIPKFILYGIAISIINLDEKVKPHSL